MREVLSRYKTRYEVDGKEITPAQLLERLGFTSAQLSTPVCDLSGGQKRRLQLMLILLDKPNVLILDEPDNDLDIDMLAVVESLLDTWPGTLFLITHDRHLIERVTDDQYAIINGKVRHVPGGVDEYLRLVDGRYTTSASDQATQPKPRKSGINEHSLKKEISSTERKLNTLCGKADKIRNELKNTNPTDYVALGDVQARLHDMERQISDMEDEWVRLSEKLD